MSRYIRTAGSSGGGTYSDSNVCSVISSYTGTLTAGDGTNICCIRTDWELICECNCIDECYGGGGCVEFTFPSTADEDNCRFTEYKLELTGLADNDTNFKQLFMKIGSANCYCTCCAGVYRQFNNNNNCGLYNEALCFHCIRGSQGGCWRGGDVTVCFGRMAFCLGCGDSLGYGVCFNGCSFADTSSFSFDGHENCRCRTCWEEFCKVAFHITPNCVFCQCGSFRMYGKRMRPSAYSGYTQS